MDSIYSTLWSGFYQKNAEDHGREPVGESVPAVGWKMGVTKWGKDDSGFGLPGFFSSTVGIDEKVITRYVEVQEKLYKGQV